MNPNHLFTLEVDQPYFYETYFYKGFDMRCITTTEQLISYLDKTAEPAVTEHIDGCVECKRRARELARSQQRFAAKLAGSDCPNTMNLGEYHLRMMSQSERDALRQHIRGCASCMNRLNQLAAQVDSPAATKQATNAKRKTPFASAIFYPQIQQQASMAQGLRGSTTESSTNAAMDYTIDLGKISIRLAPSSSSNNLIDITGLMLGVQAPFKKVTLYVADTEQEVVSVPVNRLGGFSIEGVLSGEYDLQLAAESDFSVLLREFNI